MHFSQTSLRQSPYPTRPKRNRPKSSRDNDGPNLQKRPKNLRKNYRWRKPIRFTSIASIEKSNSASAPIQASPGTGPKCHKTTRDMLRRRLVTKRAGMSQDNFSTWLPRPFTVQSNVRLLLQQDCQPMSQNPGPAKKGPQNKAKTSNFDGFGTSIVLRNCGWKKSIGHASIGKIQKSHWASAPIPEAQKKRIEKKAEQKPTENAILG